MNLPGFVGLIALPLLGSPLIYLAGRLTLKRGPRSMAAWVAVLVLAATWIPFVLAVPEIARGGSLTYSLGSLTLALDGLGLLLAAVALGLGLLVAVYSGAYLGAESGVEKFYAMLVAMVGVMIGLGMATDLFNLWIWFEAMAVCSYLLVAFYREQPASLEAGIKYLMQSAAGSTLVLLGIGLVLAERGTLQLDELRAAGGSGWMLAAGALFLIGFGVKTALVPLHTWLPDAHSQAPSGISAMLSGVVIEAGLVAMLRSLGALAGVTDLWGPLLLAFGVINMILGNLMALRQVQVKRLLAYSSLAHMGYMLVGLGLFVTAGEASGAQGGLFHLFNHGLMKGLAFLAAGSLLFTLHLQRGDHAPLTVEDLSGAARRYPLVALTLSLAVLGLGGLPPLAGFMSKWQIFIAGFQLHAAWAGWLVAFAALNSVLSLAYYAPLVNAMYRREPSAVVQQGARLPVTMGLPLVLMAAAVVAIGIWPNLMTWLTAPAGQALAHTFGG
ncbi:MAG TPA: proton-conducting transporter membrane subunit [Anaerolineales bacterium]|nr:proton-conducting transporter membrane subunit [Anaerolineales bacterium]